VNDTTFSHVTCNILTSKLCDLTSEMQTQNIISDEEVINSGLTKSQPHMVVEIVEYVPDSIVSRTGH
jgi:hypothetical protein